MEAWWRGIAVEAGIVARRRRPAFYPSPATTGPPPLTMGSKWISRPDLLERPCRQPRVPLEALGAGRPVAGPPLGRGRCSGWRPNRSASAAGRRAPSGCSPKAAWERACTAAVDAAALGGSYGASTRGRSCRAAGAAGRPLAAAAAASAGGQSGGSSSWTSAGLRIEVRLALRIGSTRPELWRNAAGGPPPSQL